jgi:hypothetical protein
MEVVVAYSLRYYTGIFLERPGKPRKTCQDGPIFEPGTSGIRSWSVNHATTTLGHSVCGQ